MDATIISEVPAPGRPRLLACDIDGTLLDSRGRLSSSVQAAVRAIAETGVLVVLATGRSPWNGVADLADALGLHGPQISMQGALIADPATGRIHRIRHLPATTYLDALRFAEELDLDPVVGLIDGHRAVRLPSGVAFLAAGQHDGRFQPESDLRRLAHLAPIRLFLPTGEQRHRKVRASASLWFGARASIVWSDQTGVELLGHRADKGAAIAWLAMQLDIPLAEVAAVGDATNDLTMLRAAGRSAAMGTAPTEVRAAADTSVATSDEDGILQAFAWFFPDLAERLVPRPPEPIDFGRYVGRGGRHREAAILPSAG